MGSELAWTMNKNDLSRRSILFCFVSPRLDELNQSKSAGLFLIVFEHKTQNPKESPKERIRKKGERK